MFALCDGSDVWRQRLFHEYVSGRTVGRKWAREAVRDVPPERFGVCCRAGILMVGCVSCCRRPLLPVARESAHMCSQDVIVMHWGDVPCRSVDRAHFVRVFMLCQLSPTIAAMILRFAFR